MIVSLADVFGAKAMNRKFARDIKNDLKKIKKIYRKERNLWKALRITNTRILNLYQFSVIAGCNRESTESGAWKKFVDDCEVGGADFLEQYL